MLLFEILLELQIKIVIIQSKCFGRLWERIAVDLS